METILIQKGNPKLSQNVNFLESSIYEKNDLRKQLKEGDNFVIRQGDVIITNLDLWGLEEIYIPHIPLLQKNIEVVNDSHYIIMSREKITLVHNEHGIVTLPKTNFHVYSIRSYTSKRVMD